VSRASERDILENFPFLAGKTCTIPVGLENNQLIKERLLLPREKQHIVHVGGFTFEKNHVGLLRIFNSVLSKTKNVHLHLIGDGPLRQDVEVIAAEMGVSQFITFYGFVNDPLTYIKAAHVLVLPSIIEGLPGVLLEAMYVTTPVIAYN